jgi:alkanesulfonate monooxygenase SsuD/methylene tetrahydromethanopterin reductase-like flavin-dependent oxidoreductase (luciferase family)
MDYGLFTMPSHPPERKLFDGHQWDLQQLRWADELGFSEAWIGEHHTAPWEPHPSPDLLVAQALMQTKRMRIGPGRASPSTSSCASGATSPSSTTGASTGT